VGFSFARAAAVSFGLSAASLLMLLPFSGRRSDAVHVDATELAGPPQRDQFDLGPVRWDVADYRTEKTLEPLREFFEHHCAGTVGLTAAWCVTDVFHAAFPHGDPAREFLGPTFDPAVDLQEHLAGAPGHCVTRSGLVAAVLLASGIPARVAQIVPVDGSPGHTVAEVWNATGWVMVDPSLSVQFEQDGRPLSVAEVVFEGEGAPRLRADTDPSTPKRYAAWQTPVVSTQIVYPEPWLYMRTGPKSARFPFRGVAVHAGPQFFALGPAQNFLHGAVAAFGGGGFALLAIAVVARRRRRSPQAREAEQVAAE
jgi:hypothetical protein